MRSFLTVVELYYQVLPIDGQVWVKLGTNGELDKLSSLFRHFAGTNNTASRGLLCKANGRGKGSVSSLPTQYSF